MDGEDRVVVKIKRAEIDTTAPFRSVKEAVMLFGERVLAGGIYASKLKEMQNEESEEGNAPPKLGTVTAELEETKQILQKAREESMVMATCLSSLQDELERTKRELRQLKEEEPKKQASGREVDVEDLKFIENSTIMKSQTSNLEQGAVEYQKKRYVTFANPPTMAKVIVPQRHAVLERLSKKKKKPLIPLIGGIFSRKKGGSGGPRN